MQDTHTLTEALPQKGVSHHNYRPNRYVAPFFIQTDLRLQGEADREERVWVFDR